VAGLPVAPELSQYPEGAVPAKPLAFLFQVPEEIRHEKAKGKGQNQKSRKDILRPSLMRKQESRIL
jgi:hypothetical protein